MARQPDPNDATKIRRSLTFYRVLAYITGIFLLLLVVEMVLKYGYGLEFELNGAGGFIALVPSELITATNLSIIIQITHGYIYMVYLVAAFLLVNWMRWPITRFILIALGGVVPLLSFFVEHRITQQVRQALARFAAATAASPASGADATEVSH